MNDEPDLHRRLAAILSRLHEHSGSARTDRNHERQSADEQPHMLAPVALTSVNIWLHVVQNLSRLVSECGRVEKINSNTLTGRYAVVVFQ